MVIRSFMRCIDRQRIRLSIRPCINSRRWFKTRQVTLEQNRCSDAIDDALSFLPAHVGSDQQIFRCLRRHPLIPQDERNGQPLLQSRRKFAHGLDRRTFPAVQLQRKSQQYTPDLVCADEGDNVCNVAIERSPRERFKRLRGPSQLVAEGDADSLRSIIQGEYA